MSDIPGFFSEAHSEDVVIARMAECPDERLKTVLASIIRHLHAVVKETEPSFEEWLAAIRFLTETGQISTEWRQEFILLSDVLGVSMLVDAVNNRKPSGATATTVLGPFHVEGAPSRTNGDTISLDGKGEPLFVTGTVKATDGRPLGGASLDVWMANADGFYDVQQPGIQPPMNLRGLFTAEPDGRFFFRSAKPRWYPIPHDGPVGRLLGKLHRHPNRPAHIHFIVGAAGHQPIVTHIFTPDTPYLETDAVFGVKADLIGDFRQIDDAARAREVGLPSPFWELRCDFVLAPQTPPGPPL